MSRGDERLEYATAWHARSKETEDVFDRFFSLWIALNIIFTIQWDKDTLHITDGRTAPKKVKSDWQIVRACFRANHNIVHGVLEQQQENVRWLVFRTSPDGKVIVDTKYLPYQSVNEAIRKHYAGEDVLPDKDLAEKMGLLFNEIRNNLFHGSKNYNSSDDREVLTHVNPILNDLLISFISK